MNKAAFYLELEELLQLPQGTLRGDQLLKKIRYWDSHAAVSFIVLADNKYGVSLQPKRVGACETVDDLALSIEERQKHIGQA